MILLTSTSDLVQIITGGAQVVNVHASYADLATTTGLVTVSRTNTIINSAATTTVVPSPGSNVSRNLKTLSIRNTDASVADTVTVNHTDGTTLVTLNSISLLAGYTWTWTDEAGWILTNASGARM